MHSSSKRGLMNQMPKEANAETLAVVAQHHYLRTDFGCILNFGQLTSRDD